MRTNLCGLRISALVVLLLASTPPTGTSLAFARRGGPPQAGAPPQETVHRLGTDSNGVDWHLRVAVKEPLTVYGAERFTVATREPLDLFEIHAAIDVDDVAWIADGKGRGVRVNLANGTFAEFRVPVSAQLVGGIAVRQGKLFYGDNPARGDRTVRLLDLASGTVRTLLALGGGWWPHDVVAGPHHVWLVNWTALSDPQVTIELVALDWETGSPVVRGARTMPKAAYVEATLQAVEAPDGAAWVANGYTERIERLDAAGRWQGWPLDGRSPSNLVPANFGAACVLQRLKPPTDTRTLEGVPLERPAILGVEIAAFVPGRSAPLTLSVAPTVRLHADRDGNVRVEGRGRLSAERGALQIVPVSKRP